MDYDAESECYVPRNGDSIKLNIDGDDCLYAVFGSDRDHTYRGHGECSIVAGSLRFDTWSPYRPAIAYAIAHAAGLDAPPGSGERRG